MKALHFGVHCSECHSAEVEEIPAEWIALEPAQIMMFLAQGVGMRDAEDNMQAADTISEFMEIHESHGAMPVVTHLDEIFNGREES